MKVPHTPPFGQPRQNSPKRHQQVPALFLFQEFPPNLDTLRFIEPSPEPEALSAQSAELDKTHSGLDSRWRALLLATGWIQKLIDGKNKRQTERTKAETHPTPRKIRLRVKLPQSTLKRNAPEVSTEDSLTAPHQEVRNSGDKTKRRRLSRASGDPVQALKKHSTDVQAPTEKSAKSATPATSFSPSQSPEISNQPHQPSPQSKNNFNVRHHNPAIRKQAIQLKKEGLSSTNISEQLGLSESTLRGWFRPLGLTNINWNAHDADTREKAIQLKAAGISTESISEQLKIHKSTLGAWFRPLNLTKPHKSHLMPHSTESREKAVQLRKEGLSTESISKQLDIPAGTLAHWFRQLGLVKKQNLYNSETKQAALEQYRAKKSVSEIAESTGIPYRTVASWLKGESKVKP